MEGISNQGIGNVEAQGQPPYQPPPGQGPPPGQPGYGPPPGAPPPGPMAPMAPMERPTGVTILAILYFIQGILVLIIPIMISMCLASMMSIPGAEDAEGDIFAVGAMCWIVFGIIALFYFIIGIGLLKGQNWARIVAIIFAIIGLLNVPIGTIISIIILLYLFKADVKAYFQ